MKPFPIKQRLTEGDRGSKCGGKSPSTTPIQYVRGLLAYRAGTIQGYLKRRATEEGEATLPQEAKEASSHFRTVLISLLR